MGPVWNIAFLSGLVALFGLAANAEVLWTEDAITPVAGKQVGSVDVGDEMHFSMDVTINSFPVGDWASVFQCGTSNSDRYPGIFLNPSSGVEGHNNEGFYVQVNGGSSSGSMGDALATGQTYHLDVDYTQNWWTVRVDGVTIRSTSKSTHSARDALPCYSSASFSHGNADVLIENLEVSTDIGCYFTGFECDDDAECNADGTCACSDDSHCADHLVCHDDGECGRDCTEFPVDDWLLDCSAEFGENENDIATLQSGIVTINSAIATIQDSVEEKADTATTDALQDSIDAINIRLDKLTLSSAHSVPGMVDGSPHLGADAMKWTLSGKDIAIIALLTVNLVIIATLFVVCRTGSGGKYVYGQ